MRASARQKKLVPTLGNIVAPLETPYLNKYYTFLTTGCPKSNQTASMGLNYNLGDKSVNLIRMNHFKKFNKTNRIFFAENARFF